MAELLQEKALLQKQNTQHAKSLESLDSSLASLQAERDALAGQVPEDNKRLKEQPKDARLRQNKALLE